MSLDLKGSEEWGPDEAREAADLSDALGIPMDVLRISMPPPVSMTVVSIDDRRASRAAARGELFFSSP